jgi:tetratricopeptide (TPR) repeat protein
MAPAPAKPARPAGPDSGLAAYADALKAMHKQDWARAVKLFAQVAADDDAPEIAARARQYLAAARQRLEAEESRQDHEDAFLAAVFEKNRGNLAPALEICRRGGREKKDERFAYLAASIHALEGRSEEAAQALSQAVELNPKNRIHAFHDADFAELRKDPGFRQLFDFP